ncbi:UNVERIFIED_CONTAM: hypothetical protein GTU68_023331 [Idotea baltica]|nr:hypothetical protein [Idotea baltica]
MTSRPELLNSSSKPPTDSSTADQAPISRHANSPPSPLLQQWAGTPDRSCKPTYATPSQPGPLKPRSLKSSCKC